MTDSIINTLEAPKTDTLTISEDRYRYLLDDLKTIAVERGHNARWEYLCGRHEIGQRIIQEIDGGSITGLLLRLAADLAVAERELWYCVEFVRQYPELNNIPEGKAVSWNKVKKNYLTEHKENDIVSKEEKPDETQDEKYLYFVRHHKCIACDTPPPSDPAHWPITRGAGSPDWWVIPLCRLCHESIHSEGILSWTGRNLRRLASYFYGELVTKLYGGKDES